ncbi:MAG: peptide chain release factor 2, partial [Acidobacteriota bacterium]|nr:peptide chain release factor 2 [Acidobacteriota bacterium]
TKHESGNVTRVLDGDLDEFIKAYLFKEALGKLETSTDDE